jgi:surface polysaccharide O-acyltransferase-like enzyme
MNATGTNLQIYKLLQWLCVRLYDRALVCAYVLYVIYGMWLVQTLAAGLALRHFMVRG